MGLVDRLRQWLARGASRFLLLSAGRSAPPERKLEDFLKAYTYWTFACVRVIAENVAEAPFKLYYRKADDTEEEVKQHVILDLLSQVNPWMTEFELRELTQVHLELAGEAWWGLEKNGLGVPAEIWPLFPQYVHIEPDPQAFIRQIEYRVPGAPTAVYTPDEVLQFKYSHPTNLYRGWSPTRAAAMPLDVHQFAMEWVRDFFFNDATPGGVLTTDQVLQQSDVNRIRAQWAEAHKGRGNAHRIAVLGQGAKFQTVERSLSELAFTDEQRRLRDDILAIYGVPKHILGITEDVNRANAEAAEYVFAKRVIAPRLRRMEQRLNEFLVAKFDERLVLRLDDPVPENRELRLKERETGVKNGWLTINEARAEEGRPSFGPQFDVPWLPGILMPAGEAPPPPSKLGPPAKRAIRLTPEQRELRWKSWIKRTEPHERRMIAALKKFFQGQQDEVMQKLKQLTGKSLRRDIIDVDALLWDGEEAKRRLEVLGMPLLLAVITESGEAALAELGLDISFDVEHPAVQTGFREQLQRIVGIDDTTREALRAELLEGLGAGEGIPQLADRVSKVFADAKGRRAETIARTETNSAASLGQQAAWEQSGVVKGKEWIAALDERTREAHRQADGQQVPLDSRFVVGGEQLEYPGDPNGSAENVINCRCTVAPITLSQEGAE